ncbi:MAG TPA: poly-gamma-glutamate biosynthesis protein [Actinobacteria bacterium]|nr:poly-gamma-glutamate biosynthesis protein [Actinomycetota bacterium]
MSIRLALAGDAMLGRGVGAQIAVTGPHSLFSTEVQEFFESADLALLNLECCVSDRGRPWEGPGKRFHFRAPPRAVEALADLGIDCVTLANNHSLDFGYTALSDTFDHLSGAEISAVGAGVDAEQARAPVLLEAGGLRVAVLGFTDHPAGFAAGPGQPGVAYADLGTGIPHWLGDQVQALAASNDVVVVLPHWGPAMTTSPLPYIRSAARALLNAGATLVAGHSAHAFHGAAGRIFYDLGDFIDDYALDPALRNDLSLLYLVTVDERGPRRIDAVPLKLEYAHTRLPDSSERAWIRARFTSACAAFGTEVTEEDGLLVIAHPELEANDREA